MLNRTVVSLDILKVGTDRIAKMGHRLRSIERLLFKCVCCVALSSGSIEASSSGALPLSLNCDPIGIFKQRNKRLRGKRRPLF